MATDIFLLIDGIPGESQSDKHKNEIDILAWSWGVSQAGSMHTGGGGGSGRSSINDMSINKGVDKSSPKLFEACCNGKHIAKMVLSANKAGEKPMEFMKVTMTDCLISSVSAAGSEALGYTESVSINFSKVEMEYSQQGKTGAKEGSVSMSYDVKANK